MTKQYLLALMICGLVLSGCSKKRAPETASSNAAESTYGQPPADPGIGTSGVAGLQEDLIATVGTDRVLFDTDSYSLSQEAKQILAAQAAWLNCHPEVSFLVEGHCDERGTRDYNLALGDRRAGAVANFLTSKGISPARVSTISYGKERPEATGSDELAWAKNRRAVSIVVQADR